MMKAANFSYLLSIILFGGTSAIALYKREHKVLRKFEWVVFGILALSMPLVVTESFALRWGAWKYNSDKVLNLHFLGTQLESYIYLPVVCFCICAATLAYANYEDKARSKKLKKRKTVRKKRLALSFKAVR